MVQIDCKNCDDIIKLNNATPMIVYVMVFAVLLIIAWAAGLFIYGRQTGAATLLVKAEALVGAFANPMLDVVEGAVDATASVVKETVEATAVEPVKKTAKKATGKAKS